MLWRTRGSFDTVMDSGARRGQISCLMAHHHGKETAVRDKPGTIWVVVYVFRGIPEEVEAYTDWETAALREQFLRERMHPEYDETGIFEVQVQEEEPIPLEMLNP